MPFQHVTTGSIRVRRLAAALSLIVACSTGTAVSEDLDKLVAFVVPAYTAMNFIVVCRPDDPALLTESLGPHGTALQYVEHIKNEAIASLTHDEAVAVLTAAANQARNIARAELKRRSPGYPKATPGELTDWCRGDVRHLVRSLVRDHDGQHPILLQQLEKFRR